MELKLTSIVCLVVAVDGLRALPRAPLRHPAAVHAPRARRIALCTTEDEIEDLEFMLEEKDIMLSSSPKRLTGGAKVIDVVMCTWSWAFLPIILLGGLSIAALIRPTNEPLRIGAPSKARLEQQRLQQDPLQLDERGRAVSGTSKDSSLFP